MIDSANHRQHHAPLALDVTVVPTAALTPAKKATITDLCTRAFGQDFASLFDLIAQSVGSMHVLAHSAGALIGHAVWSEREIYPSGGAPLHTAYVDAVATDPAYQGRGIGSSVITRLMAEVRGFDLGALSTGRVPFYARLGWERWHGPTAVRTANGDEATPEEPVMIWRTPQTPPLDTYTSLAVAWRAGQPW